MIRATLVLLNAVCAALLQKVETKQVATFADETGRNRNVGRTSKTLMLPSIACHTGLSHSVVELGAQTLLRYTNLLPPPRYAEGSTFAVRCNTLLVYLLDYSSIFPAGGIVNVFLLHCNKKDLTFVIGIPIICFVQRTIF
jgi:hypothetical protein